jgi:methionyl aminopeptidase
MTVSSHADLDALTRVGRLVARALREMRRAARAGMTTAELDGIGAAFLGRHGARSAPQLTYNFPGFSCISVNEQIVHGVPGSRRLEPGDVVKIDVTAELDGYVADAAATVLLAPASDEALRLKRCARAAFAKAMEIARPGRQINEIGRAIEDEVKRAGFSIVREMCGHGVGRTIHEAPTVPNYFSAMTRGTLREGMVIAVEPIISSRPTRVVEERDGWTLRTRQRCLAAHYEHTVMIRDGRPLLLTAA